MTAVRRGRSDDPRCPIPKREFAELKRRLGRLTPKVSLDGWADCPPLDVSPPPGDYVRGAWFDVDAVVRAVKALCELRHTKGRWANRPFVPDAWQIVWLIAPVFGWKYPLEHHDEDVAGTRIVRNAYIEIPRKAGKSTLSSGLAAILLCADDEPGAEVYAAAATKDQGRVVFDQGKAFLMAAPSLRGYLEPLTSIVRVPSTGSFFRVLSSIGDFAQGLNPHGAIIDELHVHKKRALVDAIETGTGARRQPLIVIITTADEGDDGTIYAEKHEYVRKSASRTVHDPSFYGAIWAADEHDDPFAESTWRKAQPGLGHSVTVGFYESHAIKARSTPSYYPTFCRLFLNRRMRATSRWLSLGEWDSPANIQMLDVEAMRGADAYGGLDLSATTDLTAYVIVLPDSTGAARVLPFFWMPEDAVDERTEKDQVPYRRWVDEGWITATEGKVIDYHKVIDRIGWSARTFNLRSIGHDRWQAGSVVQDLGRLGATINPIAQTYQGMSAAAKELERLVMQGLFHHGGHPVLRWMADVVEIMRDNSDNIRPVKPDRRKGSSRVDGITAATMAVGEWMAAPEAVEVAAMRPKAAGGGDLYRPNGPLRI